MTNQTRNRSVINNNQPHKCASLCLWGLDFEILSTLRLCYFVFVNPHLAFLFSFLCFERRSSFSFTPDKVLIVDAFSNKTIARYVGANPVVLDQPGWQLQFCYETSDFTVAAGKFERRGNYCCRA